VSLRPAQVNVSACRADFLSRTIVPVSEEIEAPFMTGVMNVSARAAWKQSTRQEKSTRKGIHPQRRKFSGASRYKTRPAAANLEIRVPSTHSPL
jgi:hypothetical protein